MSLGEYLMSLHRNRLPNCSLCLIIATTLLATGAANAENLYLAGFSGNDDSDSYGYIGAIIPIAGSSLSDDGLRVRLWGSYTDFEYDGALPGGTTGIPTKFEADGFGAEVAIGYRWSFLPNATATTYIGGTWKDINVEPTDLGSDLEDEDLGIKFQEEIDYQFTSNLDVSLIASYNVGYDGAYWGRIRPGYTFGNGLKIGPEAIFIGGEVFDKQRYGVFLSGAKLGNFGIGISAGFEDEASTSDDAFYGALSFSLVY